MREILFRGKALWGEWVYGDLTTEKEEPKKSYIWYSVEAKPGWNGYVPSESFTEVDQETICQYIGIEDKNGKRIFEGDIVRAIYKPKDEDLTTDDFIIKWDKCYCKYVGYYAKKENVYNPLLFGSQTSFEVIGNIFDNPELTKG